MSLLNKHRLGQDVAIVTHDQSKYGVMLNMIKLLTQKHLWSKPIQQNFWQQKSE